MIQDKVYIQPQRVQAFFKRFPQLESVIKTLNAMDILYAIGGSGCLFFLGNARTPDDVDIYLPNT